MAFFKSPFLLGHLWFCQSLGKDSACDDAKTPTINRCPWILESFLVSLFDFSPEEKQTCPPTSYQTTSLLILFGNLGCRGLGIFLPQSFFLYILTAKAQKKTCIVDKRRSIGMVDCGKLAGWEGMVIGCHWKIGQWFVLLRCSMATCACVLSVCVLVCPCVRVCVCVYVEKKKMLDNPKVTSSLCAIAFLNSL